MRRLTLPVLVLAAGLLMGLAALASWFCSPPRPEWRADSLERSLPYLDRERRAVLSGWEVSSGHGPFFRLEVRGWLLRRDPAGAWGLHPDPNPPAGWPQCKVAVTAEGLAHFPVEPGERLLVWGTVGFSGVSSDGVSLHLEEGWRAEKVK